MRWLVIFLFALVSAFVAAPAANAVPVSPHHAAAQPSDTAVTPVPGPDLTPQQQTDPASLNAETKKKLSMGGIALLMFVIVYFRNKRRWARWRKRRAAAKG
jgi:hypothetical protein